MEINLLTEKPIPKFFKDDIVFSLRHFIKHVEYRQWRSQEFRFGGARLKDKIGSKKLI